MRRLCKGKGIDKICIVERFIVYFKWKISNTMRAKCCWKYDI